MANGTTDNTAVNRLIDLAQQRPVEADDTLFETPKRIPLPPPFRARGASTTMPPPLPRKRAPAATRTDLQAAPASTVDPASAPVIAPPAPVIAAPAPVIAAPAPVIAAPARASASIAAPTAESWELSEHDAPTRPFDHVDAEELDDEAIAVAPLPAAVAPLPAAVAPVAVAPMAVAPVAVAALPAPAVAPPTLDQTPSVEARFWADSEDGDGAVDIDVGLDEPPPIAVRTSRRYAPRAQRHESTQIARMPTRTNRSWLWIGGAFVLGVAATAIIAWPRGGAVAPATPAPVAAVAPAPAPQPAVTPAPVAAAPTVAPIVTPAPVVTPAPAPVAAEPVAAEPVAAEPVAAEPVAAEPVAPAPVAERAPARPARTRPAAPAPARQPARVASKPAPAPTGGAALLMIGSKPPCDIVVDGKRTGLTTPQRALKLTPGPHKVTLVNKQYGISESFTVTAKAGAPVKVVKDLTAKMRR
jgi:hypothetical protein